MAQLENASYEEIVTNLERELELNGVERGDDIPVPTMSTAPTTTRPGTCLLSSGIDPNVTCNCKKPGHVKDDCRKLKKRRNKSATTGRIPRSNIQNVQLATKRTTGRNGVEMALEPTSSLKISKCRTPNKTMRPPAKMIPTISNQPLSEKLKS